MDISPQAVIDVLVAAGVKKWVLMGRHGYVLVAALTAAACGLMLG